MTAPAQQEQLPFDALPATEPARRNAARTDGLTRGTGAAGSPDHQIAQETTPGRVDSSCIWDGERQAFVPGTLRQAMLVRGFTPDTLCTAAGVAHGTMYNALAGRTTRFRTARRILETLAAVEPAFLLAEMA